MATESNEPRETRPMGSERTGAVLISGGLDSAILLGEALGRLEKVYPLYVRSGLYWESAEQEQLARYLAAISTESLEPLAVLDVPVADVYQAHWSLSGRDVPGATTPDEAVYLPARNVLLLSKAMLWCHLRGVPSVALAVLKGNPFADATPAFFEAYARVVNQALGGSVRIERPYQALAKREVMLRGRGLPLQFTLSCIRPAGGRHCGQCNKCAERRHAFVDAGLQDPTDYETKA